MRTRLKILCICNAFLMTLLWNESAHAQLENELTPMVSWMSGGKASTTGGGTIRYETGAAYGLVFGEKVEKNVLVEFSYSLLPTRGHYTPVSGSIAPPLSEDMTIHYLQFGAAYHALTEQSQPFLSTMFGLTWFHPGGVSMAGDVRLAFGAAFGVKFFPSPNVGLRIQTRILLPVYFSRGGFWSSIAGEDARVTAGIPIVQADLGAGLIIAF